MTYQQTLEKAILEHAAYVASHPNTRPNGTTKIAGFQDAHVWGMAMQLSSKGLLVASAQGDDGAVRVDEITDAGAGLLEELASVEAKRDAARRDVAEALEAAAKKSIWKRLTGRK